MSDKIPEEFSFDEEPKPEKKKKRKYTRKKKVEEIKVDVEVEKDGNIVLEEPKILEVKQIEEIKDGSSNAIGFDEADATFGKRVDPVPVPYPNFGIRGRIKQLQTYMRRRQRR